MSWVLVAAMGIVACGTDSRGGEDLSVSLQNIGMAAMSQGLTPEAGRQVLVVYDDGGQWGYLGELNGIAAATYASHFYSNTRRAVSNYVCGEALDYVALMYVGSTYASALPECLLDDVVTSTRPVLWINHNLEQVVSYIGEDAFVDRFGFRVVGYDFSAIGKVRYKKRTLTRDSDNESGIVEIEVVDRRKASVVARAVREDLPNVPWAVSSGNLTFISEVPFSYLGAGDRVLVLADVLFEVLAPETRTRRRAVLRIEDVSARSDWRRLLEIGKYLKERKVPFGISVIPQYEDPLGVVVGDGVPVSKKITDNKKLTNTLRKLVKLGATILMHGVTHQRGAVANPYDGVSANDTEFCEEVYDETEGTRLVGALPEENPEWLSERLHRGLSILEAGELGTPRVFVTPHYCGSPTTYEGVAEVFDARWERTLYYAGSSAQSMSDPHRLLELLYPFVVRDLYGARVLPENLGYVSVDPSDEDARWTPADIVRVARKNLVVRDGVVGMYFHPFLDINLLKEAVEGIQGLGYRFVAPESLLESDGGGDDCSDTEGYEDARGYSCADWVGYDCKLANEAWGYEASEEGELLAECPASCRTCGGNGREDNGEGCGDADNYADAKGRFCSEWVGRNCSKAVERWGYEAEEQAELIAHCAASCGMCGDGSGGACRNSRRYVDAQGYSCRDWFGYNCELANEVWGYSAAQEAEVIAHCRVTCGACAGDGN